jgi:hypothetical protein
MKHSSQSKVRGGAMPLDHFDKSLHSHHFPPHEVHSSIHDHVATTVGGAKRRRTSNNKKTAKNRKSPKNAKAKAKKTKGKGKAKLSKKTKGKKPKRKGKSPKKQGGGAVGLPMAYFNPLEKGGFVDESFVSYDTAYGNEGLRALAPGGVTNPSSGHQTG